jgi:hypothetical protein
MKPGALAKKIIDGMKDGVQDLVEADLMTSIAIYLKTTFPTIFSALMNRRASKQFTRQ